MKAKDIAKIIIDDSKTEGVDKLKVAAEQAYSIIKAAAEKVKTVHQLQSKFAVWREALTQWKAVVPAVLAEDPKHPIFINLYGAVFATVAPELFSILVEHRVFIGYQLSQKERMLVNEESLKNMFN